MPQQFTFQNTPEKNVLIKQRLSLKLENQFAKNRTLYQIAVIGLNPVVTPLLMLVIQ
jgi:hypothetical protein